MLTHVARRGARLPTSAARRPPPGRAGGGCHQSGIPHEDDLAVIGSGYGRRATPAWVHNLRARPIATVAHRSVVAEVVATEVVDAAPIWERARATYPGYAAYPRRAAHRDIAVFVLRPGP